MAQNKDQHSAKGRTANKEGRNKRTYMSDGWTHRMGRAQNRALMDASRYMKRVRLSLRRRTHRGKDYRMSLVKLNAMTRNLDNLAARREINAEKAFLHTQARTASRWMAAEPIYPLR